MSEDELAQLYIDELAAELVGRGYRVAVQLPALTVISPAGVDPQGQQVLIRKDEDGLRFCWVWPSLRPAERGAVTPEPEVEPMCPAKDVAEAVRRISNVLGTDAGGVSEGSSHG